MHLFEEGELEKELGIEHWLLYDSDLHRLPPSALKAPEWERLNMRDIDLREYEYDDVDRVIDTINKNKRQT